MIIIKLKGGLGNQLFQYAYGRLLSIQNDVEVKYEWEGKEGGAQRAYALDAYNTKIESPTLEELRKNKFPCGVISRIILIINKKIFRKYNIGYLPIVSGKKNGYLEGYWQSYKYSEPIRSTLISELTLKKPIDEKYKDLINKISQNDSVSVHIRRGDYVAKRNLRQYVTFGLEYYKNAFDIMRSRIKKPVFFIFSDDIDWAKENLVSETPMEFVSKPEMKDYEELTLMSICKYNIIANSSFSFWAAWLNQNPRKIVIAPKKWNNVHEKEYKDLLPKEWMQI